MNINLNHSIYIRPDSSSKKTGTTPKNGKTFSDTITASFGKVKTDQYTKSTSSAINKVNVNLEDEDYEYLANKWDPTQMSQDEYDEFLDYLQNKGILSKTDKEYLGYGGLVLDPGIQVWFTPDDNPVYDYSDGNVLAYMRYNSSLIYESADGKNIANLHKKVTSVMEEMLMRK